MKAAERIATGQTIRLACVNCCRDDHDWLTPEEFDVAVIAGWTEIREEQTIEESITVYDDPADAPPGYSLLDWYTHLGRCPACSEDGEPVEETEPVILPFAGVGA